MELNAVRTLRVVGRSEGVDQVASDLRGVADAQQAVAVSSDNMTRRQTSVARSFASLNAQLDPAVRAQQQFTRAQQIADRALQQAVITTDQHAKVVEQARQKYLGMVPANENMARSTGLARYELINLSRQIQDVGVSLAGGQSPFTVLVQQGSQIGDIFASSNGTLRGFVGQVAGLINPVTVLAAGTVALGAAAYGAWRFWKDFALTLDDTARAAGVTSAEMAKLQAAAAFKGIGQDDFAGAMKAFSAEVYRAQSGAGSLAELMRANGQAVKGTADGMDRVATLIQNAASDQQRLQLLQQAGLPATMEWVRLLSGGADGLKRAKEEAAAFGGAANDEMIKKAREFDEAWNKAWTNFGLGARSAIVSASDTIQNLDTNLGALLRKMVFGVPTAQGALQGAVAARGAGLSAGSVFTRDTSVDQFYAGTGALGRGQRTVDPQITQRQLSLESQRLGILSQLGGVADQVRAKEIEIAQARQAGVRITEAESAALLKLTEAQALGTLQMQQQIGQYQIEAATIGMSTGAAAAYRAEQEKLLEFRLRGITLTDAQTAAIRKEAAALGEAAQAAAKARIRDQIDFETATTGLSNDDVQIAQRLKSIYPDVATALNSSEAAAMRFNATLKTLNDSAVTFADAFVSGLLEGKTAIDALLPALSSLGSSMSSIGTKSLMSSITSGVSGKGFSLDPASLALGAVGSIISLFTGNAAKKRAEQQAAAERAAQAAAAAQQRAADYSYRAATAGLDTSTQAGALRQFELNAQRERAREAAEGGKAMAELEQALAAERAAIIEDFARRAAEAEKKAALERQGYLDRIYRTTIDTSTIAGQLAEFDLSAMREREEAVRNGSLALVELEQAQAAERNKLVRDALKEQTDYYDSFRRQVASFTAGLSTGSLSALSPAEQLMAARNQFQAQYDLALTGDRTAQGGITGVAQTLLEQARSYYGPTAEYAQLMQRITDQLGALPDLAMAQDPQVTELQRLGTDYFDPMTSYLAAIAYNTGGTGSVAATSGTAAPSGYVNDNSAVVGAMQAVTTQLAEVKAELQAARSENAVLQGAVARLQAEGNAKTDETTAEVRVLNRDLRQAITALAI